MKLGQDDNEEGGNLVMNKLMNLLKYMRSNRGNSTIFMHYEKVWPKMEIKLCVAVDIDAEALFSVLCGGPDGDRCYNNCQAAQNSHSNR